jgi:membrane-associated protease RseP (regulator of RpoE activity)
VSDERRARDRRSVILLFLSFFLAVQLHWGFAVLGLWIILLGQLEHRGVLDRWGATRVLGAILMIRTRRGQRALERLARPRRMWRWFGELSLWTCGAAMFVIILLLVLSIASALIFGVPKSDIPPSQLILIPGVNPIIPFWWPVLAIIGALVIHEYGHALQARAHGMRVRAFGLLMLGPLPLGAFAEPEGKELFEAPRRERMRMFAAGPAVNIYAALFTWLLIGALATQFAATDPGVHAPAIIEGAPADEAGLEPWEIITHFNGTAVTNPEELSAELAEHSAGDNVSLMVLSSPDSNGDRSLRTVNVTLADRHEYYLEQNLSEADIDSYGIEKGDAFLGVSGMAGGTAGLDRIAGPLASNYDQPWYIDGLAMLIQPIRIISTPIEHEGQIMDVHEQEYLETEGWLGDALGTEVMLALITGLFWFVWMNLGLGFANLIPMIPFDGGHLMKDGLQSTGELINRFSKNPHPLKVEPVVRRISSLSSLFLLIALMLLMFAQYL